MKSDTEKDETELEDTILGTALARAIETQPLRETAFASSRVATRPADRTRPFVWQALGVAAVIVVGLAIGATVLGQRRTPEAAVATQPVATLPPAQTAPASTTPVAVPPIPVTVFFARTGLPPVAAQVLGHAATGSTNTPSDQIANRIGALWDASGSDVPSGAQNLFAHGARNGSLDQAIKIDGTTATVDIQTDPPLAPRTTAEAQEIVQQLVYTVTEEPGIDHVVLLSGGKPMALGAYAAPTGPLARWDVAGYAVKAFTGAFQLDGTSAPTQLTTSYAREAAPGLARFTIAVSGLPAHTAPAFSVSAYDHSNMPGASAELEITVPQGEDTTTVAAQVDQPPLRSIAVGKSNAVPAQTYRLGLDHLWPWRAVVLYDPTRIAIDIGGAPSAISSDQNVVLYAPAPNGEVGHTFTLSGAARTFEGTVNYRVLDDRENAVLYGYATATVGTSGVWGGYDATIALPASLTGNVTVEVFEVSPKDGTETSKVAIRVKVRSG